MEIESALLGSGGAAAFFAVGIKLWSMFSQTKSVIAKNDLGTSYDSHLYSRMKELEIREAELHKKILSQAETIGALNSQISELKSDLDKAQQDLEKAKTAYKKIKDLLHTITTAYDKLKVEHDSLDNIKPTSNEGRPWLVGDKNAK